jgi:hypothetical protein
MLEPVQKFRITIPFSVYPELVEGLPFFLGVLLDGTKKKAALRQAHGNGVVQISGALL